MPPGSRVRIIAHPSALPQTLAPFAGRIGVLVQWEDEMAVVQFGSRVMLIAAGRLEKAE